ncbi:DsbA family oxidoreductase [Paenibacillus sedimenti]|uniref:DsbA family oxidoreductase n=1 Tax=Paenibacillus sedimenti TaxID=2770274 RepID=A0A926QM39_9BACL|nr:DsbA family oxidoreductase [Paenibacillus sedimenti]MBD0383518.1 DsbA family oxidoreductase [Paenibacillus sedimenti]
MQVEIWSDIACPFCYIGKSRIESGLAQFAHKDQVEIVYKSFQLDEHAPLDVAHDVHDMLSAKYGMSREEAKAMNAQLGKQAEAEGLDFHFDTLVLTNTLDAHRLLHFAAQHGKSKEVADLLFKAYFTESKHVGRHETLTAIAAEAGLDPNAVSSMLASDQFADEVRADQLEGSRLGVRGVPFYVINRKYAISGAQSASVFLDALEKAWGEKKPLTVLNDTTGGSGAVCTDGVCSNE